MVAVVPNACFNWSSVAIFRSRRKDRTASRKKIVRAIWYNFPYSATRRVNYTAFSF
jgi:hypothetical protein